jgi:hypothetical protein
MSGTIRHSRTPIFKLVAEFDSVTWGLVRDWKYRYYQSFLLRPGDQLDHLLSRGYLLPTPQELAHNRSEWDRLRVTWMDLRARSLRARNEAEANDESEDESDPFEGWWDK